MIRNIIVALAALLLLTCTASAGRGNDDGTPVATCYFDTGTVSGVGANLGPCASPLPACDGVTSDFTALESVRLWIVKTWQAAHTGKIAIVFPNGKNCFISGGFNLTFGDIKDLLFWGYGSTISGQVPHWSIGTGFVDAQHSVRVNTVAAGSMSVTINPSLPTHPSNGCLTIAACAALFNVGDWALMFGGDLQGATGSPFNPWQSQYVKIASVNATTGVITFTEPLAQTYKSTWPNYNSPAPSYDYGGPGTLEALPPSWNSRGDFRGITVIQDVVYKQLDAGGFMTKYRDFTCNLPVSPPPVNRVGCFAPSFSKSTSFYNIKSPVFTTWEVDKLIEDFVVENTNVNSNINITFQSAGSNARFTANNSTLIGISGSPTIARLNNMTLTASTLAFTPGAIGYGASVAVTINGGNIASFSSAGVLYSGGCFCSDGVDAGFLSMSNGIIHIPNAYIFKYQYAYATNWFQEGENFCWADSTYSCAQMDQMTDVTQTGVFNFSLGSGITIASPAVVTLANHGLSTGDIITFNAFKPLTSMCVLPTGMTCLQLEYVKTVTDANHFTFSDADGGTAVNTTRAGTPPYIIAYGNTDIHTTACCGFPTWGGYSGVLTIKIHPVPQLTFTNVTSADSNVSNFNFAPAKTPIFGYYKQDISGVTSSTPNYFTMWGNLDKITASVTTAYGGMLSSNTQVAPVFSNFMRPGTPPAVVPTTYVPLILNVKSLGTRSLDAGGGTTATWACTSGACAGDTRVDLTTTSWCAEAWLNSQGDISSDQPGHPMAASIEVLCRQNVVIPPLPPGWLP